LCLAHIPGLPLRRDIEIDSQTILISQLGPLGLNGLVSILRKLGWKQPRLVVYYGEPASSFLLVTWSKTDVQRESDIIRFPLLCLNIYFRCSDPLVEHGHIFATPDQTYSDARVLHGERIYEKLPDSIGSEAQRYATMQRDIAKLARILRVAQKDPYFETAMQLTHSADSKYSDSYQLRTRIIEYTTAVESLLLDQEAELGLRFALRSAVVLSRGPERSEAYGRAKAAYRMRSAAVHGTQQNSRFTSDDANMSRQFCYDCLASYADLNFSGIRKSAIIQHLDAALLSASAQEKLEGRRGTSTDWSGAASQLIPSSSPPTA
jgi:hypothetical protein